MKTNDKNFWDKIGLTLSSLCLLHCLALPVVIVAFPALKSFFLEDFTHKLFGSLIVVSAYLAFWPNFKIHKQKSVLIWGSIGVALIIFSVFLYEHTHNESLDHIITMIASAVLIYSHIKNIKCAHAACAHSHHQH
jgi:hypothetical protein